MQPKEEKEVDLKFGYCCNGCDQSCKTTRFICLNCRPGPFQSGGFVEFCEECTKKLVFDKNEDLMKIIQTSDS